MAKEIERKFLLADDSWRASIARFSRMQQGYIGGGDNTSVRVRISGDEARLNIKVGGLTASRDEYEYAIPVHDAEELLSGLDGSKLIEKTRYWVSHTGFEWEIDEFHGTNAGLLVAELELDDEAQQFPRPGWLGKEVTHLVRYYNVHLVGYPYEAWTRSDREP